MLPYQSPLAVVIICSDACEQPYAYMIMYEMCMEKYSTAQSDSRRKEDDITWPARGWVESEDVLSRDGHDQTDSVLQRVIGQTDAQAELVGPHLGRRLLEFLLFTDRSLYTDYKIY